MSNTIFIPEKINVGFQNRNDTYTKMLAYIIYWDAKGTLRKETSWQSWRDKTIDSKAFENVPTSGFVLNKKVGGNNWSGWNHRNTYVRVYDPRGFEFEIDVPNLLWILENTSSIKGKGLEGEFVYGWDGKELVLLSTESPDYKEIKDFSNKIKNITRFTMKDIVLGGKYLDKKNRELFYVGRFDYYERGELKGKKYFFYEEKEKSYEMDCIKNRKGRIKKGQFIELSTLTGHIIQCLDDVTTPDYAEIMEELEHNPSYSPYDESKDVYIAYTLEEVLNFENCFNVDTYWYTAITFYGGRNHIDYRMKVVDADNSKRLYRIEAFFPKKDYHVYYETIEKFDSLKYLYEKYQPKYKVNYLANNKLYMEEKHVE